MSSGTSQESRQQSSSPPLPDLNPNWPYEFWLTAQPQFAGGLLNLETGVRELRIAYLNHFNSLLPEGHPARLDSTSLFAGGSFLDGSLAPGLSAVAGALPGAQQPGQKRKRKPHDPNAPKRALTSYFLFMQSNKPQIKEANPNWSAQQVSEESERRWANITPHDKLKYEYMYNVDLARYYKQKEEYDAGRAIPTISPNEAQELYNEHLRTGTLIKGRKGKRVLEVAAAAGEIVPAQAAALADADGSDEEEADEADAPEEDAEAEDDDEDESEEEAPPPKSKKQKTAKSTPAKATPKKAESPEKKKPRGKKSAAADADSDNSLVEEPKEKKDKKPAAKGKRGKASGRSE